MPQREPSEQEFREVVRKVLRQFDRHIITGEETAAKIAELCREAADLDIFVAPDLERARLVMESCTRVVDEEVGNRPFGDSARISAAYNLWSDLVERPRSWDAFRRRCREARQLVQTDRQAALRLLLAVARSGDPEVGMLDDRQTQQLVRLAEAENLPELIELTLPPQAMVGHGRVDWENARRRLADPETAGGSNA